MSRVSPSSICQLGFYFCRKKETSECTQDFNFFEEVLLFSELNLRSMRHTLPKLNVSPWSLVWMICAEWNPYSHAVLNVSLIAGVFWILREGSVGGFYTATAQLPPGWQQLYDAVPVSVWFKCGRNESSNLCQLLPSKGRSTCGPEFSVLCWNGVAPLSREGRLVSKILTLNISHKTVRSHLWESVWKLYK